MKDELFDIVNARDESWAARRAARCMPAASAPGRPRPDLQRRRPGVPAEALDAQGHGPRLLGLVVLGHVDAGEDYDASAVRELGEELGLALPAPPARWFRLEACAETGWEFVWVYRLRHEGPFTLNRDEIEAGAWFDPADLAARLRERPGEFASSFRLIWARAG